MIDVRQLHRAFFGLLVLVLAVVLHAEPTVINLPGPASDFAIDEGNGTTAVTYADQGKIAFYPKLWQGLDNVKEVTIGKAPVSVIYKRSSKRNVFVAVCRDDSRIFVFDAKTLGLIKDAKLSLSMVSQVRTSLNPADPYVYYCGGGGHDSRVAQFNVETMEDHGAVQIGGMGNSVAIAYVSADGTVLYTLGPWSPSGFQCYRLSPRTNPRDPTMASQIMYEHDSRGGYVPDRFSASVAAGSRIYSPDLRETLVDLHENVLAFSPYDPAVVTMGTTELSVWSTNTYRLAKKVPLPTEKDTGRGMVYDMRPSVFRGVLLWEPSRQFVMFCKRDNVTTIPVAEFSVDEPLLGVDVSGSLQVGVGTVSSIGLKARAKGTAVALESGPKGMTLSRDTLVWTPTSDDVGPQQVVLSLKNGSVERKQKLTLTASQSYIALPFVGNLLAATPDGKRALICRTQSDRLRQQDSSDTGSTVCIIDLESGKAIAQRQIAQPISSVEIDAKFVYLALADSDAAVIWSAEDLSDVKRVFTPGRVARMKSVAGKLFVACSQGGTTVMNVPGFEAAGGLFVPSQSQQPGSGPAETPIWMGNSWFWKGATFDPELRTVLSLRSAGPLVEAIPAGAGAPTQRQPRSQPSRWSVFANGAQIRRASGQVISQITSDGGSTVDTVILESLPAAVTTLVRAQGGDGLNPGATRVSLEFRDLISGQACASQTLMLEAVNLMNVPDGYMRAPVVECTAAGKLLVRFRDRLFVVPLLGKWVQSLEPPLSIEPKGGVTILDGANNRIEFSRTPAAGNVEYSLRQENPAVSLNAKTGAITFDPAALRSQAVKVLVNRLATQGTSAEDGLAEYRRTAAAYFRSITGHDAAGIPVAVPVEVIAQDAQLQQSSCRFVALLEVPLEEAKSQLQARAASNVPPATPAQDGPLGPQSLDQRVAQLEQQVRTLQAKLDVITELLRNKQ